MKNKRSKTSKRGGKRYLLSFAYLLVTAVLYSCSFEKQPLNTEPEIGFFQDELNIEVKYLESYDQTEVTYTRLWPGGIAASMGKAAKQQSGGELMVDYEVVHHKVAFDDEGYMYTFYEFLEGDGEMNMPEEMFEKLKGTMPARSADYDPITRVEMSDGTTRSYTKSGKLKYEQAYNPEEFRIDPALLDSMNAGQNDEENVDQSVQRNMQRLQTEGINFNVIGNYYAAYDMPASNVMEKNGLGMIKKMEDLRTGNIVKSAILRTDGNYQSITLSRFQRVNGASVLASEERFTFGEINGEWGVTHRTEMHRENIQVIRN